MKAALRALALAVVLVPAAFATVASADGPGSGTPSVAALGDSYISGEAGRWAGNSNEESTWVDALGSHAYHDNATNTAEVIPGCHRSLSTNPSPPTSRERTSPRSGPRSRARSRTSPER